MILWIMLISNKAVLALSTLNTKKPALSEPKFKSNLPPQAPTGPQSSPPCYQPQYITKKVPKKIKTSKNAVVQ